MPDSESPSRIWIEGRNTWLKLAATKALRPVHVEFIIQNSKFEIFMITPELLSPAGDWDCARAAVAAGADAIYFGLPQFNARLRADNFTNEDLPELMEFLHHHGVKGFVTMNTLIFTGELEAAEAQLRAVAEAGVDALIIQDLGLAKMARTICPGVEIHASTQMTITSPEGLRFVESLFPLERAVLARELSVREIERFHSPRTPLEVFVHGALCVAYSGQCLTSESLGQRSANRGECAQACRMPYEIVVDGETRELGEVRYLLSPQDLAAVDLIPDLVKAGVKSYKIEGRLKSPEYVTAVTRVYRKALDAAMEAQGSKQASSNIQNSKSKISEADRYALEMTFSRGLSTGWLAGTNHPYLTHGRFGKKRGPLLGTIEKVQNGWIKLTDTTGVPVAAGDGVVFDAGENRDLEQGARIWKIEDDRIVFHKQFSGINFDRIQPGHTVYKTSDPRLESELRKAWQNARLEPKRDTLDMVVSGKPGEALTITSNGIRVRSEEPLQEASKRPLDADTLAAQLSRLGDTRYQLGALDNQLEGDCHLAVSAINRLRRQLVAKLDENQQGAHHPTTEIRFRDLLPGLPIVEPKLPTLTVLCRSPEQLDAAIEAQADTIYLDYEDPRRFGESVEHFRASCIQHATSKILLATPRILKPGEIGYLKLIERAEPDGLLLRNLASLEHYRERTDLIKIGDFSLNVANPISAKLLMEQAGLERLTISYDLNIGQVLELAHATPTEWLELTLHQHMPMFHMEHCVFCVFLSEGTTYKDCGRPCEKHVVHLRDRVGQLHRLQADVGCRNTLFNGRAQTGARYFKAMRAAGLSQFRIELLDEDRATAIRNIRAYQRLLKGEINDEGLMQEVEALEKLGVTEGTLAGNA